MLFPVLCSPHYSSYCMDIVVFASAIQLSVLAPRRCFWLPALPFPLIYLLLLSVVVISFGSQGFDTLPGLPQCHLAIRPIRVTTIMSFTVTHIATSHNYTHLAFLPMPQSTFPDTNTCFVEDVCSIKMDVGAWSTIPTNIPLTTTLGISFAA